MTTTTKIFIILVCLFAFIFTPMAIQFAAQTNDWKRLATDLQDAAETEAANASSLQALLASEQAAMSLAHSQHQAELSEAARQRNQLMQQITALTAERDELRLAASGLTTTNELQGGALNIVANHNKNMIEANRDLTKRELELQTRNGDLLNQVKTLNAEMTILRQELQKQQQQLVMCREENENFRRTGGFGPAGERPTVGPTPSARAQNPPLAGRVEGKVTAIQGHLATLDVGSSSGLRDGVRMVVLRGDAYVCDLVITSEIQPNQAVGEVVPGTEQGRAIRPGDTVLDEVSFNARG